MLHVLVKGDMLEGMILRQCKFCDKEFSVFPSRVRVGNGNFCSVTCARFGKPTKYWLGKTNPHFSKIMASISPWNRGGSHGAIKGKNHWNWQGGITEENKAIRASVAYKRWRQQVYKRDNWTCVLCGYKGNQLIADHIKSFSRHPSLRLETSNGRVLCKECHKKTPNYCGKARNHD